MKNNLSNLLTGLAFAGLLIGSAHMQMQLKNKPQVFMLLLGVLTLISFFTKYKTISTILLYMLLATLLYMTYFSLTYLVITGSDDWLGIYGIMTGLILSPLTILLYHKMKRRNKKMEVAVTAIFVFVTTLVYINYELLQ
ncbi:MAG TPA: hypothetical protein VIM87_15290 [Chitinophaga sp.]|uniref:hypothetical protein n=1 Tax=Chitinophaga sp. TaxID=1869181 RepID=UPI002F941A80